MSAVVAIALVLRSQMSFQVFDEDYPLIWRCADPNWIDIEQIHMLLDAQIYEAKNMIYVGY